MDEPLRIVFMGTAPLAAASLERLLEVSHWKVVAVVTQPDRPRGRHLKPQPSPVKKLAAEHQLEILQPQKARDPRFIETLSGLRPDLIVVAAYGQILPQAILDIPRHGCLNVHASLLPKYRGAAPIQWAILNDEPETGVTLMKMDAGMDTGDILAMESTPVLAEDTAGTLHDRLARMGGELLVHSILPCVEGRLRPKPQPEEGASYARKIKKEDGLIDWNLSARAIGNQVRGLSPWPGAYTFFDTKKERSLLKIHGAAVASGTQGSPGTVLVADKSNLIVGCGLQSLRLVTLQLPGGRPMGAAEFLAGHAVKSGQKLG